MKITKMVVLGVALLAMVSSAYAQRNSQIEFYGGVAFPMAPDFFKDYTKVGLSGNLQYVIFPSPRLGITFNVGYERFSTDNDKFVNAFSETFTGQTADFWIDDGFDINPSADITASAIKFGVGVRPYLTTPEASTQFFLLGQVNYNLISNDWNVTQLPTAYNPLTDVLTVLTADDGELEDAFDDNDEKKIGFAGGAGLEIPAGSSFNIVLQGLFNVILTEDESTSFIGVTAGLVF